MMLFIHVEMPLHAGTGRAISGLDLPVQRDAATGYPIIQSGSLKGGLRATFRRAGDRKDNDPLITALFGAGGTKAAFAGALSVGDARVLLFPVRSLHGVFAWATSREILGRFCRDAVGLGGWTAAAGSADDLPALPPEPAGDSCWVPPGSPLARNDRVTLEEFTYEVNRDEAAAKLTAQWSRWFAAQALPQRGEYGYLRERLQEHFVILPETDMRDFLTLSTEVAARVQLNPGTKTVEHGPWTEEYLPRETVLYAVLMLAAPRQPDSKLTSPAAVAKEVRATLHEGRTQFGGNETVGRGFVVTRLLGLDEVSRDG